MSAGHERAAVYWTCNPHEERLTHESVGDAVEAWSDETFPNPLPATVEVYGFAPCEITPERRKSLRDSVLEDVLERLDGDFGDFEDATDGSAGMVAAAQSFVDAVLAEYHVVRCDRVTHKTVNVAEYVPQEWMEAGK